MLIGKHGELRRHPEIAQRLGEMTGAWSYLEWHLGWIYKRLTGFDQREAFEKFFKFPGTGRRVSEIEKIKGKPCDCAETIADLDCLLKDVRELIEDRNSLTHDVWFSESRTGEVWTFNYRAPLNSPKRGRVRTAVEVQEFTEQIIELCDRLTKSLDQAPNG